MPQPLHTLASGVPLQSRYGELGGFTGSMIAPPEKITAFIVGLPGEGKSCFLQSHPDAFIFNLDGTSTTTPDVRATIWPGINSTTGRTIDEHSEKLNLTWDLVMEKVTILRHLSFTNSPRPETVVIDSLSAAVTLLRDWIPRNASKLSIGQNCEDFNRLHGPAAYDALYHQIQSLILTLFRHGYGVYLVGHIVNATIQLGDDRFDFRPELTITPGFWKRIYSMFELVAPVCARTTSRTEKKVIKGGTLRGKEQPDTTRDVTIYTTEHYIDMKREKMEGIIKSRVHLPDKIILPLVGGWDAFREAYMQAIHESQHKENSDVRDSE